MRGEGWDIMVDLFFYRDPAEVEIQEQETPAAVHEGAYEEWTDGMEPQVKPQTVWTGADQPAQPEENWGETDTGALQPIPTQSFLPTASTAPDDQKNWGDDTWGDD